MRSASRVLCATAVYARPIAKLILYHKTPCLADSKLVDGRRSWFEVGGHSLLRYASSALRFTAEEAKVSSLSD